MFAKDLTQGLTVALALALGLPACSSRSSVSANDGASPPKDGNGNSVDSTWQQDTDQPDAASNGEPETGFDTSTSDSQIAKSDAESDAPANRDADSEAPVN